MVSAAWRPAAVSEVEGRHVREGTKKQIQKLRRLTASVLTQAYTTPQVDLVLTACTAWTDVPRASCAVAAAPRIHLSSFHLMPFVSFRFVSFLSGLPGIRIPS